MTPPPPPPAATAAAPAPAPGRRAGVRRPGASLWGDRAYAWLTFLACVVGVAVIVYLIVKTVQQTGEVWETFGVWGFITGTEWIPTPVSGAPQFGALPFIYGTLMTAFIAMVLAVPAAIGVALATTVLLPRRFRSPVAKTIDLLAAVPSVVYGLWGITILVPFLKPGLEWLADNFGGVSILGWHPLAGPVTTGSYLVAGLVLSIMVLPIIAAITREILATVPRDQQEAAYALGATRWEMVRYAMLPWARSGIVGASALGLGRAVGETIAIAVLLGNSPGIFDSLLGPGATLASVIALETGEAGGLQLAALTALAVVLFVLAFVINLLARLLVGRGPSGRSGGPLSRAFARVQLGRGAEGAETGPEEGDHSAPPAPAADPASGLAARASLAGASVTPPAPAPAPGPAPTPAAGLPRVSRARIVRSRVWEGLVWVTLLFGLVPLVLVLVEMLRKGLPAISWDFFTELPPLDPSSTVGGISNALVGTLIMMGLATLMAAPLGLLAALFTAEVGQTSGPLSRVANGIGFFVDILLGVPSVVVGLTVYLGVVVVQGHFSATAGAIALAVIMFPIVVRSCDEILRLVPDAQKEAALALGAPRWRVTWSVILPAALPGILTGIILAMARAAGETAPLLFTSLGNQFLSTDLSEPIAAIPQLIYYNTITIQTEASIQFAWGAALVLVSMIFVLNLLASVLSRRGRTESR